MIIDLVGFSSFELQLKHLKMREIWLHLSNNRTPNRPVPPFQPVIHKSLTIRFDLYHIFIFHPCSRQASASPTKEWRVLCVEYYLPAPNVRLCFFLTSGAHKTTTDKNTIIHPWIICKYSSATIDEMIILNPSKKFEIKKSNFEFNLFQRIF